MGQIEISNLRFVISRLPFPAVAGQSVRKKLHGLHLMLQVRNMACAQPEWSKRI
ncbi:hypothetical protein I79_014931 [Cricetulus griseus]|uniref:Uncharacterized protein n=1 Tax=Cricetulus griseus TaxID=10029 RepID=G3HVE4_CRIGR|nr:hypothetical protein I79_014931 [Cricetulus griseus]